MTKCDNKNEKNNITRRGIIAGLYAISFVLGVSCVVMDKKSKELDEKIKSFNAAELAIKFNCFEKIVYVEDFYSGYSLVSEDGLYTRGEYLYDYMLESDFDAIKLGNNYYTEDEKNMYEYNINQHFFITDEEYDYPFNGSCKIYKSKPYEELKNFDIYYDVDEDSALEDSGCTYYKYTRKIVRKK